MSRNLFELKDLESADELTDLIIEETTDIRVCDSVSYLANQIAMGVNLKTAATNWIQIAKAAIDTYKKHSDKCVLAIYSLEMSNDVEPIYLLLSALKSSISSEIKSLSSWIEAGSDLSNHQVKNYNLEKEMEELLSQVSKLRKIKSIEDELKLTLDENELLLKQLHAVQDKVIEEAGRTKYLEQELEKLASTSESRLTELSASTHKALQEMEESMRLREQQLVQNIAKIRGHYQTNIFHREKVPFYKRLLGKKHKDLTKEEKEIELLSKSDLFDSNWYLAKYPDVAEFKDGPIAHYVRCGYSEMRDPSPLFSTHSYLMKNADVEESGANPLVHYIQFGKAEGRPL